MLVRSEMQRTLVRRRLSSAGVPWREGGFDGPPEETLTPETFAAWVRVQKPLRGAGPTVEADPGVAGVTSSMRCRETLTTIGASSSVVSGEPLVLAVMARSIRRIST